MFEILASAAATGPNWAEVLTGIGAIVSAGGLFFAGFQVRETRRDRHVQVLTEFGKRWDDERMAEARELQLKYTNEQLASEVEKWLTNRDGDVTKLLRVPNYFEDLGLMARCGRLHTSFVDAAIGTMTVKQWDYWSLAIVALREKDDPRAYREFEKLAWKIDRGPLTRRLRAALDDHNWIRRITHAFRG